MLFALFVCINSIDDFLRRQRRQQQQRQRGDGMAAMLCCPDDEGIVKCYLHCLFASNQLTTSFGGNGGSSNNGSEATERLQRCVALMTKVLLNVICIVCLHQIN